MALTASLLFVAFGAHLRQGGDQDRPGSVEGVLNRIEDVLNTRTETSRNQGSRVPFFARSGKFFDFFLDFLEHFSIH